MYKQRLEEYIEKDKIYQAYKKQKEIETSDFDNFCILHCEDIEEALFDLEQLKKENNQLKEQLKDEEEHRIKIAKDREQTYKECLLLIEQKKELRSWLEEEIHNIVPEGCGINYNCEYDSEEDYVRAMEERSRLNTLKDTLSKLNELEGKNE